MTQNPESPALYTLISMDPDAPSRANPTSGPWRHAIIEGLLPASLSDIKGFAAKSSVRYTCARNDTRLT